MRIIFYLTVLVSALSASAQVPAHLLSAIHKTETGGKLGAIKGDNGAALGPFQIHKAYWQDATEFDKSIGGTYADCANYNYSVRIVNAYMARYAKKYLASGDFESVSRIHNGGPQGHKKSATLPYWEKVKQNLHP